MDAHVPQRAAMAGLRMDGPQARPAALPLYALLAVAAPILLALGLAQQWGWRALVHPEPVSSVIDLQPISAASAQELAELFARHHYDWPPTQAVPALSLQAFPTDLAAQPVEEKKALFFQSLLPLVLAENQRLLDKRAWLEGLRGHSLETEDEVRLQALIERYRIDARLAGDEAIEVLLQHVDKVPIAMVLAQAANESGWGSSRFVLQANNLFGEWTWRAEEGIAPLVRNSESRHYVRRFDSLADSVRAYIYNITVGHAYGELRAMRAAMRAQGRQSFDSVVLANGLERYSIRGEEYVTEIQQMIRGNRLQQLGPLQLEP